MFEASVEGHVTDNFLGQSEGGLKSLEISSPSPKLNLTRVGVLNVKKAALLISGSDNVKRQ